MKFTTTINGRKSSQYGIERPTPDEPGIIEKYREKWPIFDHFMRMQERFNTAGGAQLSAGITYFSILSLFPITMLLFSVAGFILANNADALESIESSITGSFDGQMADMVSGILEAAIAQRGTVLGIGGLTALWSGLNWMNNLRFGVSNMWAIDPTRGGFVHNKLRDLLGLIILIVALIVAFGITAVGSSGFTAKLLDMIGLGDIPGIGILTWIAALVLGVIANLLVIYWLIVYMPRVKVPRKPCFYAALAGAIAFEIVKQVGSLVASSVLKSPAGIAFGPVIGIMVILYVVWQIIMYCSAWAATSNKSLKLANIPSPEPATIHIRNEVNPTSAQAASAKKLGVGFAAGAAVTALISFFRSKK